jgi:hypothetical protein
MEVDGLQDGLAVGKYLRVKVRMPINRPLMRGTTVEIDDSGKTLWCPFEYEFLPNFCYVCGMIGHLDKECTIKLKKGEEPQYGRWLRWMPQRKQNLVDGKRGWSDKGGNRSVSWASGGSKHGSDGSTWRKEEINLKNSERSTVDRAKKRHKSNENN